MAEPVAEGQGRQGPADVGVERGPVDPDGVQQGDGDALPLGEQSVQEVRGGDLGVAVGGGLPDRGPEGVLRFRSEVHGSILPSDPWSCQ